MTALSAPEAPNLTAKVLLESFEVSSTSSNGVRLQQVDQGTLASSSYRFMARFADLTPMESAVPRAKPEFFAQIAVQERARAKFNRLKAQWVREMPASSRMRDLTSCDAYLRIVGMGEKALPFLIEEVRKEPRAWYRALELITEANPVTPGGGLDSIAEAWARWATENGV